MTSLLPPRQMPPAEVRARAVEAFEAVFIAGSPYGCSFRPEIASRTLVYPTMGFLLSAPQFEALEAAASEVGDTTLVLNDVELWDSEGWAIGRRQFLEILLSNFDGYAEPGDLGAYTIAQNALYSPQGAWGMLISDERHAIVGGPPVFIDVLLGRLGVDEEQVVEKWLERWKAFGEEGADLSWIWPQLVHLLGEDEAAPLWTRHLGGPPA